jgi:glucose-1-phosphate adenylyltransferase
MLTSLEHSPREGVIAMKRVVALILAGGQGGRLSILSQERAKPAVPFAGKYRIIDFTLSNCVNSGIFKVGVLTQYRPRSLNEHIGIGKPWDLDRQGGGVRLLQPFLGPQGSDWYKGTADAVYQNIYYAEDQKAELVLVLSGDHIYKMDYSAMVSFHERSGADVTVAVTKVPLDQAHRFGIMTVGDGGRVTDFVEKPQNPQSGLVSMGVYVFNRDVLTARLEEDAKDIKTSHDFGRDVVPRMVKSGRVFAYMFAGYWRDVGTVQTYWEANMDLLEQPPAFDLYDTDWLIHTKSEERAPASLGPKAQVTRSLISHGCIINGQVEHSVLSPGVRVEAGAVVKDSIIMNDTIIGKNSTVQFSILDKEVVIGEESHVGSDDDDTPNQEEPTRLNTGISLVGKWARIPSGTVVGRNCKIYSRVREDDFTGIVIPSGHSVAHAMADPLRR